MWEIDQKQGEREGGRREQRRETIRQKSTVKNPLGPRGSFINHGTEEGEVRHRQNYITTSPLYTVPTHSDIAIHTSIGW